MDHDTESYFTGTFACSGVLLNVDCSIYSLQNVGKCLSTRVTSPVFLGFLTFEDGTDVYPKTPLTNYQFSPHNIPEQRRTHIAAED